jgi:AraC-like DNA-binding protein
LFLQGKKRIDVGKATYLCGESSLLLTSVDLPVVSQIIQASEQEPILALIMRLEMPVVREILSQEEQDEFDIPGESSSDARGISLGVASDEMLGACSRLLSLLDTPEDIPFLSGLIQREIIYRFLRSAQGKHLRAIATVGDQNNRTAKAIGWLRENYTKSLRVEDLAAIARMGVSTFHQHFRSLTAMSPIQYQKHLRLHTARQRILNDGQDAATAAFEVGYESASQFNREYSRFFGQPPMRDVKAHRLSGNETARA